MLSGFLCAGINRHEAEEEEALQERSSDPLGLESCVATARDSPILRLLQRRTRAAVTQGATALKAARVVVAEHEIIISNLPFAADPYPVALRDTTHVSVCKLSPGFLRPLKFVEDELV